jgi:uncharacterized repeat protein (TIGR01451 family)
MIPVNPVSSQVLNYEETLKVYLIGDTVFWRVEFSDYDIDFQQLSEIEAQFEDVSEYYIFSSKYSEWVSEYDLFSQSGFDLIGFDFIPKEGIFLEVNSSNEEAAKKTASLLNSLLGLGFVIYSSTPNSYVFYSQVNFNSWINEYFLKMAPNLNGFENIVTSSSFISEKFPIISFKGEKSGGVFHHTLTLGSVKTDVLESNDLLFRNIFPEKVENLTASPFSELSTIEYRAYGAFFVNNEFDIKKYENFTSSFSTIIPPGDPMPLVNASVVNRFPSLLVTSQVSKGYAVKNDIIEVKIRLKNIGTDGSSPIEDIIVDENWWVPYFDLESGNPSQQIEELAPEEERVITYSLRANTDSQVLIEVPSSEVRYSFLIENDYYNLTALMNEFFIYLNKISPSLRVEAFVDSNNLKIGSEKEVEIAVFNQGNSPAFDLRIGNNTSFRLLPDEVWNFDVDVSALSLTLPTESMTWSLEWVENGESKDINSNDVRIFYDLEEPRLSNIKVDKEMSLENVSDKLIANVTLISSNIGQNILNSVIIEDFLPTGLKFLNGSAEYDGGKIRAQIDEINPGERFNITYIAEIIDQSENYVFTPVLIKFRDIEDLGRLSNSITLPLGVELSKFVQTNLAFKDYITTITVKLTNHGSLPIFNASLDGGKDVFITIISGNQSVSTSQLAKGDSLETTFEVKYTQSGNFQFSPSEATFSFAGSSAVTRTPEQSVTIFNPITVKIEPSKSPIEETEFPIKIGVENPSNMTVTNVIVVIDVTENLQITEGNLQYEYNEFMGGEEKEITLKAVGNNGVKVSSSVTFEFEGQTLGSETKETVISISDNIVFRFGIPLTIAIIIAFVVVLFIRKSVSV